DALEPSTIDQRSMSGAIRLWREYFWPHARAALRQIGLNNRHADARRVLRWVQANRKTEISREDIRREALSQRLDAEQTQQLLDKLVQSGWLRTVVTSTGGRARRRWAVHPRLLSDSSA